MIPAGDAARILHVEAEEILRLVKAGKLKTLGSDPESAPAIEFDSVIDYLNEKKAAHGR